MYLCLLAGLGGRFLCVCVSACVPVCKRERKPPAIANKKKSPANSGKNIQKPENQPNLSGITDKASYKKKKEKSPTDPRRAVMD